MQKIIGLVLAISVLWAMPIYAEDSSKDYAGWWIQSYGVVSSKDDPLVGRAEKIFEKVSSAADRRAIRLVVIKGNGDPYAQVIKDGSIILTHGGLKICYKGVSIEKGDSRLAFVLGHEIAHLVKDDYWHSMAFATVKEYSDDKKAKEVLMAQLKWDPSDPKTQTFMKNQELQADSYGLIYMTMAGYEPKAIIDKDKTNFFEDWVSQITGKVAYSDATHSSPSERAEFVKTQLQPVVESLDYFTFGVRLYQLGRYPDAIRLFEKFETLFKGREVYNNIGLANFQLAMENLSGCDETLPLRFKLPTILDVETTGMKLKGGSEVSSCFQNETYQKHMKEAVKNFEIAKEKDPTYMPARINLSSALIMAGEYSKAMAVADEALKIQPDNPDALNNKAIALYLFGKVGNIETADNAISILKEVSTKNPFFSNALYNMASIQSERGREASASETWKAFLKGESKGVYADAVKRRLEIKEEKEFSLHAANLVPPVQLGYLSDKKKKELEQKGIKGNPSVYIGKLNVEIYRGENIKLLSLDETLEVEEVEPDKLVDINDFKKKHGEAVRAIKTVSGNTLIYGNFAVDVVDGKVVKMVYFKREMI